jgi:hypothetical protein
MIVLFSIVNGVLMPKFGYYMPWYLGGSTLVVIGASLMCKYYLLLICLYSNIPQILSHPKRQLLKYTATQFS